MLIVEEMMENSVIFQGELESSTISISFQQSIHLVLRNLNFLIDIFVRVVSLTHIFYGMMHRR